MRHSAKSYWTVMNIRVRRDSDNRCGVIRIRKYNEGPYTLYVKMYDATTHQLFHRSLHKFDSYVEAASWADKFASSAIKNGAKLISLR